MTRLLVLWGLVMWVGATLLLSTTRWFARRPLTERLRPYTPGGLAPGRSSGRIARMLSGATATQPSVALGAPPGPVTHWWKKMALPNPGAGGASLWPRITRAS